MSTTAGVFNIQDFGAIGDGQTMNTRAVQAAANACRDAGGGVIRVPAGTFLTGVFELFSGTTLLLEKRARLLASPNLADHRVGDASVGLLYARDAHHVTLTGEGTLDGNAPAFFDETFLSGGDEDFSACDTWQKRNGRPYGTKDLIHGPLGTHGRPGNMVIFARCTDVRIENLIITGAAYWTIHCADCRDVSVDHLWIDNDLRHPNNDGLHFSTCRAVRIRNCRLFCGDDCIAVTGFRDAAGEQQIALGLTGLVGGSEDIEASDCLLVSRSAGVRIGYGPNPCRDIRLRRLEIRDSNRGVGIFARQSDVEDVLVEDCKIQTQLVHGNWWGRGEPIHLSAVRWPGEPRLFKIRRMMFRDIEAIGETAVALFAEEPGAIEDVTFTNVHATLRRGDLFEAWGGNIDLRPTADPMLAIIAGGTSPLWAIGVSRLRCDGCRWELDKAAGPWFSAEPVVRDRL